MQNSTYRAGYVAPAMVAAGAMLLRGAIPAFAQTTPESVASNFTSMMMAIAGALGLGLVAGGVVQMGAGYFLHMPRVASSAWMTLIAGGACILVNRVAALAQGTLGRLLG